MQLSQRYVDMLRDHPVPVDLKVIARLRKPMAIDVYWWLTKRVYNLARAGHYHLAAALPAVRQRLRAEGV